LIVRINACNKERPMNEAKYIGLDVHQATICVAVLRRFYPALSAPIVTTADSSGHSSDSQAGTSSPSSEPAALSDPTTTFPAANPSAEGYGQLTITSYPDAAEIFVDGKFVGNAPATLKLSAGPHAVLMKSPGRPDYSRTLDVPKSSKLTLKALFEPQPES
jgi:hypothetical protein